MSSENHPSTPSGRRGIEVLALLRRGLGEAGRPWVGLGGLGGQQSFLCAVPEVEAAVICVRDAGAASEAHGTNGEDSNRGTWAKPDSGWHPSHHLTHTLTPWAPGTT